MFRLALLGMFLCSCGSRNLNVKAKVAENSCGEESVDAVGKAISDRAAAAWDLGDGSGGIALGVDYSNTVDGCPYDFQYRIMMGPTAGGFEGAAVAIAASQCTETVCAISYELTGTK